MFANNLERHNSDATHIVSLDSEGTPPPRSLPTHRRRRSWRDLVERPDVHELPWHAVEIGSKAGLQNQFLVGTLLLQGICKSSLRIANHWELHVHVYSRLITEMAGGEESPQTSKDLFFVKKIYDIGSVSLQPMPFPMYVHGKCLYQRITDPREIDHMLIKYIHSQLRSPRSALAGPF